MDQATEESVHNATTISNQSSLSSVSTSNPPSLKERISDVVSFSLCSLSAIKLNYLYPEHYHE